MSCLAFNGTSDFVRFTAISSALANLPNGAATMAALCRIPGPQGAGASADICGLTNSAHSNWYHTLSVSGANARGVDDDGQVIIQSTNTTLGFNAQSSSGANNYVIYAVTWTGGSTTERFHLSSNMGSAESWTHDVTTGNNGALRAGPGTTGHFQIGYSWSWGFFGGDVALVGVWAGVALSDVQCQDLWVNKKTSDWYTHAAGTPTTLIECNTTTPVDIGSAPSTFSALTTPALTAPDPTGWTFDGTGAGAGAAPPIWLVSAPRLST